MDSQKTTEPSTFNEIELCYQADWDTTVAYRLSSLPYLREQYKIDQYRVHSDLTAQLAEYIEDLKPTETFYFIERVWLDTDGWLTEKHNMSTHQNHRVHRRWRESLLSDGVHSCFCNLKWTITKNTDADDLQFLSTNQNTVSWETNRVCYGDELRVDYINWGCRGRFGAYVVVTMTNPSKELLKLWSPCANKYVAIVNALCPNLVFLDSSAAYARNKLMLEKNPVHQGSQGPVEERWPTFPGNPPMNAMEAANKYFTNSSCDESDDSESV